MPPILAYLVASLLYAALAVWFWRTRWQGAGPRAAAPAWARFAVVAPLLIHGYSLQITLFGGGTVSLGLGNAISAIVGLTVLVYWVASFFYRIEGLQALLMPVASVAALAPVAFPAPHPLVHAELPAFRIHLLIGMLAYSLFTIAALHALLMAVVERRLHHATVPPMVADLPPLLTMETLLFRVIWTGFILLTLTLVSGVVFSEALFGTPLQFNHKTLFGIISWVVYAALLAGRQVYGWRGKVAVRWTLAGFVLLLLAYVGTKFVLEVILHR
ncbi:MAG: cytochrome c biogenesis protein CcsA [Betaproteobacteria bacterium]|nr:cytochrome c biogenesis protein CcsA [Betaproteobacteria bacterium]